MSYSLSPKYFKLTIGLIITIYYAVGISSLLLSPDSDIINFTPLTLILSLIVLLLGVSKWSIKLLIGITSITILGFCIEAIGVNTHWPFGAYSYSSILGVKFYETPLIIGINWLVLLWCIIDSLRRWIKQKIILALLTASGMVIIDFLIEPVAIYFNLWNWSTNTIPTSNYVAWFFISFILALIFSQLISDNKPNYFAHLILFLQLTFFVTLGICLSIY